MSDEIKTVYLVKWWDSVGIVKTQAKIHTTASGTTYATSLKISVQYERGIWQDHFFEKNWYPTEETAQAAVNAMRESRIRSLEKKLAKLRAELDKPTTVVEK